MSGCGVGTTGYLAGWLVGKQFPGSLFSVLSGLGWVFGFCLFGLNLRHLFFAGGCPIQARFWLEWEMSRVSDLAN